MLVNHAQHGLPTFVTVRHGYLDTSRGLVLTRAEAIQAATHCADERRSNREEKEAQTAARAKLKKARETESAQKFSEKLANNAKKTRRPLPLLLPLCAPSQIAVIQMGTFSQGDSKLELFVAKEHGIGWASEADRFFNGSDHDGEERNN